MAGLQSSILVTSPSISYTVGWSRWKSLLARHMKHIIKRLTDQATIPSSTSDHGNHGYDVIVCHFSPSCSKQRECSNCLKSSERGRCNLCHEPGHTIPRDKIWYEHAQGCCFDSMSMCIDLTTFLHIWCNHLIRQLLSRHLILQVNLDRKSVV